LRDRLSGFLLEAFYGEFELLNTGEEALGQLAGVGGDAYAVLAMETGGWAAAERIFELLAAGAAGAETGGGLGLGHGFRGGF